MKLNREGKTALATTSSGGIGLELARSLTDEGASEVERKLMTENRQTNPQEIGDIVTLLCSARVAVINGSCIRAEGGFIRSAL